MKRVSLILDEKLHKSRPKNLSREFQVYAVYICESLGDTNYPLYMRLAKVTPRTLLEQALNFVKDYQGAKSKPKLFLWKIRQLKQEAGKIA